MEVGKAIAIDDNNRHLYEPYHYGFGDIIAYCKGKNGHYYVIDDDWGRRGIIRLQRITQLRVSDYIQAKVDGDLDDEFYSGGQRTMLAAFERAVANHKPYRRKTIKKDMQKHPCYRWEADFGNALYVNGKNPSRSMTETETRQLTNEICLEYGVKPPRITFNKSGGCSYARGSSAVKYLMNANDTVCGGLFTVIHETAHVIDAAKGRTAKDMGHGPKFIGIYIKLLNRYANINIPFLEEKAKTHKLKIEYTI